MTITLKLSANQERRLREGAARHDARAIRQVLLKAVESTIERLLDRPTLTPSEPDFEVLADRLAEGFAATASPDHRPLPDEAVTREGIYGDHP